MLKKIANFFGFGRKGASGLSTEEHFQRHRVTATSISSDGPKGTAASKPPERIRFVNEDPMLNRTATSNEPVEETANVSLKSTSETASLSSCTTTTTNVLPANPLPPLTGNENVVLKPKSAPAQRSGLGGLNAALQQPVARAQSAGAGTSKNRRLVQPSSEFSPFNKPAEDSCASTVFSSFSGNRHKQPIDPLSECNATSSSSSSNSTSGNVVFSQKAYTRPALDPFAD
jgi:hypothetical protein